jgi:hypothetical protein
MKVIDWLFHYLEQQHPRILGDMFADPRRPRDLGRAYQYFLANKERIPEARKVEERQLPEQQSTGAARKFLERIRESKANG